MSNFNFNKIILGGRLTADPELRTTQSGIAVCTFSVAVTRKKTKEVQDPVTDFFTCQAWRNTAEMISKYFRKGSSICVTGELQNRNWTDQQGVKRYATDVIVSEVSFVDSKGDGNNAGAAYTPPAPQKQSTGYASYQAQATPQDVAKFEEIQSDDDLPF